MIKLDENERKIDYVFFDYFTFTMRIAEVNDAFDLLGIKLTAFERKEGSTNHYTHEYNFKGDKGIFKIKVAEMDYEAKRKYEIPFLEKAYEVNVNMTGRTIREYDVLSSFSSCFEMLYQLQKSPKLYTQLNFTRVDFSKDDKDGLLHIDRILEKLENGEVVTRLQHSMIKSMFDKEKGIYQGKTLYVGKKDKNSEFFIRIYNKNSEVYAKSESGISKRIMDEHNVRLEMVFKKGKQANPLMEKVFECYEAGGKLGDIYSGVLINKFLVLKDGEKVSKKASTNMENIDPDYAKFVDDASRLELGVEKKIGTIDTKMEFLETSYSKTMAMIYEAVGPEQFNDWLTNVIMRGEKKLDVLEWAEIQEYRRTKEKDSFLGREDVFTED